MGASPCKNEFPFSSNNALEILPQKASAFPQLGYADDGSPIKARRKIN